MILAIRALRATIFAFNASIWVISDVWLASTTVAVAVIFVPRIAAATSVSDASIVALNVNGPVTSGAQYVVVATPALAGAFVLSATGTDAAATKVSATATVTDANAGLMTQIDALNAKIVALNALIAKIMKKLGVK